MIEKENKKEKYSVNHIRNSWISFFKEKFYKFKESSSLIPEKNDKSLLWLNSGIAALKKYFSESNDISFDLVNCQRVIRLEDLPDLDNVDDFYHQTLFEMLGIFSINSNFKKETIPIIWEWFTSDKWLGIEKERLIVTVWDKDKITIDSWINSIGLKNEKLIYGNKDSNFWDMGDGPCGSNTEIYYDFFPEKKTPFLISDLEDKRFVEICNIVFPDLYHNDQNYIDLKKKCVDTGAGLERIAMVLQGKKNTFEIDIWDPVIKIISDYCTIKNSNISDFFIKEKLDSQKLKKIFYIIADHLRTIVFSLADGAFFNSKGRGYILKKLLKRVVLETFFLSFSILEINNIIEKIIYVNSCFYPYLEEKKDFLIKNILFEVEKILFSLKKQNYFLKNLNFINLSAKDIFFLYDTKGIPLRLIKKYFEKNNTNFPDYEFNSFLSDQRNKGVKDRENKKINKF